MRDGSSELESVLRDGSFEVRLVADVFYDDDRTAVNLPVSMEDTQLAWDVEAETPFRGSTSVKWQGEKGESLSPARLGDTLAPYGQEISLLVKVSFGATFNETILLGRFRIESVPSTNDSWFGFGGRAYVSGSVVKVELVDLIDAVRRWAFRWPGVPQFTNSTWAELQQISGLPVARNLPDRFTPPLFVYQPGQGNRLKALQQLMSYLGGVGVVNSQGELTSLPFAAGPAVLTLSLGDRGTVIDIDGGLDASELWNEVSGAYQDDDGVPIYATAWVSAGPLRSGGPYGTVSAPPDSDDTVKTQDAAIARVRLLLQQYLAAQTVRFTISCIFDPRAEIGDVVHVEGPTAVDEHGVRSAPMFTLDGRLVSIGWSGSEPGLMTVVLDVGAALEAEISAGT